MLHRPALIAVREERAELTLLRGDATSCGRQLREAPRLYTEVAATGHAERLARELASVGLDSDCAG